MKRLIFTLSVFGLLSCNSSSPYEPAIKELLGKEIGVNSSQIKIQKIEIKELPSITAGDSIQILKEKFKKEKEDLLKRQENLLKMAQDNQERARKLKMTSSVATQEETIRKYKANIDSIGNSEWVNPYEGLASDKVLHPVISCRFTYTIPVNAVGKEDMSVEELRTFYLSPDKKEIVRSETIEANRIK